MAITNAQQYQQLVNPPMKGKKRPGYRGDAAYGGPDKGNGQASGGDRGDRREQRSVAQTLGISPTTQSALGIERPDRNLGQREFDRKQRVRAVENFINRPTFGFTDAAKFNLTPLPIRVLSGIFSGGTRPVTTPVGGGGDSQAMATIPTWMQLGFSSEAEYLASLEDEEDKDKEAEEGLRLAFRANGGRIGLQEGGGIEQRL